MKGSSFFNQNGAVEPSYLPDMAEEIDSLSDRIAQMLKDGGPQRVANWHLATMEAEARSCVARELGKAIAFLIQPCRNLHAKVWGLAFSCGLASRINGVVNISKQSKKDGCSRALISHYKRIWDKIFGYTISVFGKSPEACVKYREARLRFLERQKTR